MEKGKGDLTAASAMQRHPRRLPQNKEGGLTDQGPPAEMFESRGKDWGEDADCQVSSPFKRGAQYSGIDLVTQEGFRRVDTRLCLHVPPHDSKPPVPEEGPSCGLVVGGIISSTRVQQWSSGVGDSPPAAV